MLRVLCPSSELEEYGEVIAVGDRVDRLGAARGEAAGRAGGLLDEVAWELDRYVEHTGAPPVRIAGTVAAIHAVVVRLTRQEDGWGPAPDSTVLEPLRSTADTRRTEQRVERVAEGARGWWGVYAPEEGDEQHVGWLITLQDAGTTPAAPRDAERPGP